MHAFDYAIVRVVPRIDRGEQINAGLILHCKTASFLAARIALDRDYVFAACGVLSARFSAESVVALMRASIASALSES